MNAQIDNGLKVMVSAALAMVLTLTIMTGISGARSHELTRQAAISSQAIAAASGNVG